MVEYFTESFLIEALVGLADNESSCVRNHHEFDRRRVRLFAQITAGCEEMIEIVGKSDL